MNVAVTTARGRSQSKFNAYIEGGPELAAKLNEIDNAIRRQYAKDALTAGGRVLADEWSARAPVGEAPDDPHPGAYRESLEQDDAVTVKGTKTGAGGTVRPGRVAGIADDQQPAVYAAVLEFADGEPSARPAFDASRDSAADAIGNSLRDSLRRYSR